MFNLEQAILEWRRQMAAGGVTTPELLNELESHLRDDVDQRLRSGIGVEQAFEAAVRQIGPVGVLKTEFAKIGKTEDRRRRMLKGICCGALAGFIMLASLYRVFGAGLALAGGLLLLSLVAIAVVAVRSWRQAAQARNSLNHLTSGGQQAFELAREEAPRLHHNYIGTEHVLLGLTRLQTGVVPKVKYNHQATGCASSAQRG